MVDPQIRNWVEKEYFSEKLFRMAVSAAPEETVKEIAVSFSDFQQVGGEMKDAREILGHHYKYWDEKDGE